MAHFADIAERIAHDLHAGKVNSGRDFLRHKRKGVGKSVVSAHTLQKNENQNVYRNKNIVDIRRYCPVGIVVTDWKHF
jgi:hypothetical protein